MIRRVASSTKPTLGAIPLSGHPLTPDRASFIFNERGGVLAVNGRLANPGTLTTSSSLTWDPRGLQGRNPVQTADYRVRLAADPVRGLSACSLVAWANMFNNGTSQGIAGAWSSNTDTSVLFFTGGTNRLILRVNGGTDAASAVDTLPNVGFADVWMAGTYDGTTARVYIDGVEKGSAAASGTIGVGSPPSFDLMQYVSTTSTSFHGTFYLCYIYSRALGAGELRRLMVEPYGMYAGLNRSWLDAPAAGPNLSALGGSFPIRRTYRPGPFKPGLAR